MFKTFHIETISVDYCLEPNGIFCLFCFKDRNSKINSKQNSTGCRGWQKYCQARVLGLTYKMVKHLREKLKSHRES